MAALTSLWRSGERGALPLSRLALMALAIFVSVLGGLRLSDHLGRLTALWLANALLVYFLLKHERRVWPAIIGVAVSANFVANLAAGDTLLASAYLPFCNLAGVLTIVIPITWLALQNEFTRPKPLALFYALALGPAPAIAGLLGAIFFHFALGRDYLGSAIDWYATDALCYSIVVPVLMTVTLDAIKKIFSRDQIDRTLRLLAVVGGVTLLNWLLRDWPLAYLFFPAVVLVTFQRGFAGGSIALLIVGTYLMVPVLLGDGSVALRQHPLREQIIVTQTFVAVLGFLVLLVGAALAERKRLEDGLAAAIVRAENSREEAVVARDSAIQANRMKSMFLATMSHELRTPLNAIIGFSELMQAELHGRHADPRYREYSGLIQDAGRHLLSLINDVLDMSKIEAGKFELNREHFDARMIVRECLTLMGERARQGSIALGEQLPPAPLFVEADLRAIKQILLNLLSNAVKFTPEGGRITVGAETQGPSLVLKVKDTGIGVPPDQLSRLGNPFVQVRSSAGAAHEGTGLGLALVRALTEMHGGSFKIESVVGKGTTVTITLPDGATNLSHQMQLASVG